MAEIVAGIGLPHNPGSPAFVAKEGPGCETARFYRTLADHLVAAKPDALIVFSNDHFNTFFLNNFPTFAIGITDATSGPNDQTPMPGYKVPVEAALGAHIRATAVGAGVDLSLSEDFTLDHAFMVPLHFLTPRMDLPVVPIWINGFVRPLPLARRCHALGHAVRAALESFPQPLRVAVVGSGSFSLEIGGPRTPPGERSGVPDPTWCARIQEHLEQQRIDELIAEATPAQLWRAGNAGGELLNWIAMLGAIGGRKPRFIAPQDHGHAFAAWRWD